MSGCPYRAGRARGQGRVSQRSQLGGVARVNRAGGIPAAADAGGASAAAGNQVKAALLHASASVRGPARAQRGVACGGERGTGEAGTAAVRGAQLAGEDAEEWARSLQALLVPPLRSAIVGRSPAALRSPESLRGA